MLTTSAHSVPSGSDRSGQPAWRRLVAVVLIALLSPVPALLAFWADANSDGQSDSWVDPLSGHVFTLAELDAFSDDIDGDGLSNSQEMAIGTNPFSPDTDGDGISDLLDPLPLSASNLGPANGIVWGAIALDDADGDGIPNFLDDYPYGQYGAQLGTPDTDGDGIPDFIDPAPEDPYNTSPFNGLQWMGDALADADGDGVPNFHDWYPYDSALWDPLQDPDGDGFVKAKDPLPSDPYNPSPVNGLNWGPDVYGDSDGDGIPNFYDAYPYDSGNGYVTPEPDSDGDGIPDSVDPSPWDYYNFSAANGVSWQGDARGDADGDGISNFYDQFPYDYYNGNVPVSDMDGDGIPDAEDPAPTDPTNLSPINGGLWYTAALADADGDGNPNFTDPWPYDPTNGNLPPEWDSPTADTDGDGIPNAQDPALADPMNFSIYNGTSWYGAANGDIDGDGIANFRDEHPYDYYNGGYAGPDSDGDGIPDSQDPYPSDPTNGAGGTGGGGDPQPEPDTDGDGRPDSQDPYPNDPYDNADFDHDGIPDVSDPARFDPNNLSPFNGLEWYADVRGDADGDGILNFWDLEPYGPPPVDTDGDGLIDSIDPAPTDPNNFSAYNKSNWSSDALGDADGDGIPNFFDTWPNDSLNGTGDADMDGIPDAADPVPSDPFNYSTYNQWSWSGVSALGDADNDGILNYFDAYPDDPYNGLPPGGDADSDGIPNEQDPDPRKDANTSPYNGVNWGAYALGDADGDGTANYWDSTPFGDDRDGDGIRDDLDPAPDDPTNTSWINGRAWYADALGDNDLDGDLNFHDPEPEGGAHDEPYLGELPSASAAPLVILNDGYDELGEPPAPGVTPDRDLADEPLAIKAGPLYGFVDTKRLTELSLSLPAAYLDAGGSVTITQEGNGAVRVHAVRMQGSVAEEYVVPFGSSYVPPADGGWGYWIEGVTEGPVTLTCHFPQRTFGGVDSDHPQGAMADNVDEPVKLNVVRVRTATTKVRANGNFDEGRLDLATGFALKDCDDDDLRADRDSFHDQRVKEGKIVTTDLTESFFGIIPADLPAGLGDGASVTIRKIATMDVETGRPDPGVVRLYAIRNLGEQDEQAMVIPQNINLAPVLYGPGAAIFMGKGEGVRYWIEGVEPGKLTLELTIKEGELEYSQKHEMHVVTEQDKAAWQQEVRNEILLESGGTVDIAKYTVGPEPAVDPSGEWPFMMNRPNVQAVFRHYEKIYRIGPDKFQWAGLAKLAGAPVYAGLSDAQHGRVKYADEWISQFSQLLFWKSAAEKERLVAETKQLIKSTQALLVDGNIKVFEDLAWQFAAYRCSGLGALNYVYDQDERALLFDAWASIDSGVNAADTSKVLKGNKELLEREQKEVLAPIYIEMDLLQSLEISKLGAPPKFVSKAFSFLAKNPVPRGPRFIPADSLTVPVVPYLNQLQIPAEALVLTIKAVAYSSDNRRISRFEDRWDWIERDGDGMWPLWLQMPKVQSIALVSIPLRERASIGEFVLISWEEIW